MTRTFLFQKEQLPALQSAWPQFNAEQFDGAAIEIDDANNITLFEGYGEYEDNSDPVAFDHRFDVSAVGDNSPEHRALVALCFTVGEEIDNRIGEAP